MWWMNALHWLGLSFPAQISDNLDYYMNVELADMHFTYGAAKADGAVARSMYMELFQGRTLLGLQTFHRLHGNLYASESFYASRRHTGIK